jgi:adenylate cyclase
MGTEIERKFLVAADPPTAGRSRPIRQGYLATGADGEVRLRQKGDKLLLTVKRGSGEVRAEHEIAIEPAQFEALWPATEGRRVVKTRSEVPVPGAVAELDVYAGALKGLRTVEVEFPSPAASAAFEPPGWFGRELTGDERWSNARLAIDGPPAGAEHGGGEA